jgi:hypothetical protein
VYDARAFVRREREVLTTVLEWFAVGKWTPRWFALLTMAMLLYFGIRDLWRMFGKKR